MEFRENALVEVRCYSTDGFSISGTSYYTASVVGTVETNWHWVCYHNRLHRYGAMFMELVHEIDIRPWRYPYPYNFDFAVAARVEAYLIHAWRVGTVIRKDGPIHYVELDGADGLVAGFHFSNLRFHLEWNNDSNGGTWFVPQSGYQSNQASTSAPGRGQPTYGGNQASTSLQGGPPGNRARTSLEWGQLGNQASTSMQGNQPRNRASSSMQRNQPGNQTGTWGQWDQPADDPSRAKRRRF